MSFIINKRNVYFYNYGNFHENYYATIQTTCHFFRETWVGWVKEIDANAFYNSLTPSTSHLWL